MPTLVEDSSNIGCMISNSYIGPPPPPKEEEEEEVNETKYQVLNIDRCLSQPMN